MRGLAWLLLAVAGPCCAASHFSVDPHPSRADAAAHSESTAPLSADPLAASGPLPGQEKIASNSLRVDVAELSARHSFADGQGTVVAVSGNEQRHPSGNLVFVHARDRFGNTRTRGDDLFSMDPLMVAAVHATQLYIGGGSYQLTYWWETQQPRVAFEVCPRSASSKFVAHLGQCERRAHDANDDRALAYSEVMVVAAQPAGQTSAHASTTTCLAAAQNSCGRVKAVAGVAASFAIEARTASGAANYGDQDIFLVTLDGHQHVQAQVNHLRLNYYEVSYVATQSGDYKLSLSMIVDGDPQSLLAKAAEVRVFAAAVDPFKSSMSHDTGLSVVDPIGVALTCRDGFGNMRDAAATAAIRNEASGAVTTRRLDCLDGFGKVSLRSTASGMHMLLAHLDVEGVPTSVSGSPLQVDLQAGPVDISRMTWENYRSLTVATDAHQAFFQARDQHGNSVDADDLVVYAQVTTNPESSYALLSAQRYHARCLGSGSYQLQMDLSKAAPQLGVAITVSDHAKQKATIGPFDLSVTAGPVDLDTSTLETGALRGAVAGEPLTFRVSLSDAYGNPRAQPDLVELSLIDQAGIIRASVEGTTQTTRQGSLPSAPGVALEEQYVLHTAGTYVPRIRLNHILEVAGPTITVTFGAAGPARVFGWRVVDVDTVSVQAGSMEHFLVQSLDSFGNERSVDDLVLHIDTASERDRVNNPGCTASYLAETPGLYKALFLCVSSGTYVMRVSTASVHASEVWMAALTDDVNTPHGIRLSVSSSSDSDLAPPVWLVRPAWYRSAGLATHDRRLQVEIDYQIELQLEEDDLSALLSDESANATDVEASFQATLDARMEAAAAMMTGGNFTQMLAESVNEAAAQVAMGCFINADEATCTEAGCRYREYPVSAICEGPDPCDSLDPQSITLQDQTDFDSLMNLTKSMASTVMRVRPPLEGGDACVFTVPESEGATISTVTAGTRAVNFTAPADTSSQDTALANQLQATPVLADCIFTTCVPNVTVQVIDAGNIENFAPANVSELLESVIIEEPAFSGSAVLTGSSVQNVVCGESETIGASVYDSFNNLQTSGTDDFDFQWVSQCLPTDAQRVAEVERCAAVSMSGADGGRAECENAAGCFFSSFTADPPGSIPTISFNSTTSMYSFDFAIRNCQQFVHFTLSVNDVNVTTQSGSSLLSPQTISCSPGDISAAYTQPESRSRAVDPTDPLPAVVDMVAGDQESINFVAADLYDNTKTTGGEADRIVFDITVPAHTTDGQQVPRQTVRCGPDAIVACGIADFNNGRYQTEYEVRYSGTYSVDILVVDATGAETSIFGNVMSAQVVPGAAIPALCTLTFSDLALTVGTAGTVTIEQFDTYGNSIPATDADGTPQPVVSSCTTGQCNQFFLLVGGVRGLDPSPDSPLLLSYSSTVSGTVEVEVFFTNTNGATVDAGRMPGEPATEVTFEPSEPLLSNSLVVEGVGRTVDCIAGADSEFVIQTRDQFGNNCETPFPIMPSGLPSACPGPVSVCAWSITLTECLGNTPEEQEACASGGTIQPGQVSDSGNADGQYRVSYNAPNTGYYKVRVQVTNTGGQLPASNDLTGTWLAGQGSPFVILSDTSAVASACEVIEVTGQTGLQRTRAGGTNFFKLQANGVDANGHAIPRRGSGEVFEVGVFGLRMSKMSQTQQYEGLGVYQMQYQANATGYDAESWQFTVEVKLNGNHISGSPFTGIEMTPADTDAVYTHAEGRALADGTAGMTEVFQVFARDEYNNAATECVADWSAFVLQLQITSSAEAAPTPAVRGCTAEPFAVYEVEYTVTRATDFSLYTAFLGDAVSGSPHSITIGSSTVSAAASFISVTGEYRDDIDNELIAGVAAVTGDFDILGAGEAYTFFLHTFDEFNNRLTQNVCADETGAETVSCLDFAFRWCRLDRDLLAIDADTCHSNVAEPDPAASLTKVPSEGDGVYRVETATGVSGLSRSGGYRVDVTIDQADGTTAALNNSHFLLAVDPAPAFATSTVLQPPLTIMASQTVSFEMAARDEFGNSIDHEGSRNQNLLEFEAVFVCQLAVGDNADCATAGEGVEYEITYLPTMNRYQVSFTVDSGGNAASLQMTMQLGGVDANTPPFQITVRAAQNEPSLCYVLSTEAGTSLQRQAAGLLTTTHELRGRDCLNLDHKIAGESLSFTIQSVLTMGTDRSFGDWRSVCTPSQIALENNACDRLDEFELVAINQVTQEQVGPFREDCANLCAEPDANEECPNYQLSECVSAGLYGIGWSTTSAGDWEVTIRSLGVMIQTEPSCPDGSLRDLDSDPPGACPDNVLNTESRPARFERANLLATGYLFEADAVLASFVTHVYPAAMSATTSEFELTTECDASTPCMRMGSEYAVTVVGKDQYGNQLEDETDAQGQPCENAGCLAERIRATVTTECRDASPLCTVQSSQFVYDANPDYPGHLRALVLPIMAGLAKLQVDFEESPGTWVEFSSGKLPAVVTFGVGAPTPNSGFKQAGDTTQVVAAIYGFFDPPASIVPEFSCEWVGASVGGVHRTAATLLTESLPNLVTVSLTIEGGGAGVSWELECLKAGTWDLVLRGGGGTTPVDRYDEYSPCRENVADLEDIATAEFADDPRKVAVVDWSEATCSSALEALHKYGMSCDVQNSAVAEACPVACQRCTSHNATTLTVTVGVDGECRLKPTLESEDTEEGSTLPSVTVWARDAVGITLLPEETLTETPDPMTFTAVALRKVRCEGGPPVVEAKTQSLFEVSVKYTSQVDSDTDFADAGFEAGQSGSQRSYASMPPSASFFFYEDPIVSEVKLSTNAELYPGRPLFGTDAGRRVLQAQLSSAPDYGGDTVFAPATGVGDPHIPTLLSIIATEVSNGAGGDKSGFECMFNSSNGVATRSPATYLSDTELECGTPDFAGNDPDQYDLLVSKNGQHFSSTGKVIQTFGTIQIEPTFAAVQGIQDVSIELHNGLATQLPLVYCRFGDWAWPDSASDRDAPEAGESGQSTNALGVPLAGSIGDVVAATWEGDDTREVWRCPLPEIQDTKTIKDRNIETPVRISYDGKAWTNAVDLFYFDQPDVNTPDPPIGPTGGGTLINLRLSGNNVDGPNTAANRPRAYYLRKNEYEPRCMFTEITTQIANVNASVNGVDDPLPTEPDRQELSLVCNTPPNPQPGSKYDLDVSLDGGVTWAYDSDTSSGRALPSPPEFAYYAETAVITQDATTNYDSSNYFRGRIQRQDGTVDVRFQYSCGYTTAFATLVKCKFGGTVSTATLTAANVGATVINQLTCDVPEQSTTGIVDLQISLNGRDFTAVRAGDTTFVYFGAAVALRAWWQADASASATRVGTPGSTAGTTQVETDEPPTLAKKAQRVTSLDVIRVEIIDDQGSFVSEDPRKGARISLALVQLRTGQDDVRQSLTTTVGTHNPGGSDEPPGRVYDSEEFIWMSMKDGVGTGTKILNAPGVGDVEPQPGTTMFVGLQLFKPDNGNYEVRLDMSQDGDNDCTGCTTELACGCQDTGCCLAPPGARTWADAIAAGEMEAIPQFRLGLTMLVGDTSIVDTVVPDDVESLKLEITPIQSFQITLNTMDSAGNARPEGGDTFQMRMYLQENEVACGDYVTPSDGNAQPTTDAVQARLWCGAAACGASQVVFTAGSQNDCSPADNRAKRIQIFEETCLASTGKPTDHCLLTPADGTTAGICTPQPACDEMAWCSCTYKPERLICTNEVGTPLCQQYDPTQSRSIVARDGSTETVNGVGGALPPGSSGVYEAEDLNLGVYSLLSGMLTAQEVTVNQGLTSETKVSLRLYGVYVIVIEGNDPQGNLTTSNVIGGQAWVEIDDSPQYGLMSKVDCSAMFNEQVDPPSPLLGGLVAPLVGAASDAEGKVCQCIAGYERNTEYRMRSSAADPPSSGLLPGQVVCKPCNKGYFKDGAPSNTLTCQPCPVTTTTLSGRCREKIRAVSSSNGDNGYFSSFGDLTPDDSQWYLKEFNSQIGESDCVEADDSTWDKCRRGSTSWKSDPTDARACEGVTNQGFRGSSAVPDADRTMCEAMPTHRTALLNETYQEKACVYEPSQCEKGECTSKSVCQCQDRHYDFRNIYLVCQKTAWFRLEASKDRMDSGGGTPGLRTLDKTGTHCASCPDCVKCYENGTIVLESEYWTFDENMKMPAPYYWENWAVPLRRDPETDPECHPDDPYSCPAVKNDVKCPDNKCIYAADPRSPNYKHWMITAYRCLHSPGGVGAPTCLGGDWALSKVGQGSRDAIVYPGTDVACTAEEKAQTRGTGRPGCDFVPRPVDDPESAKYSNGFCLPGSAGTTCAVCGKGYKKDKGGEGCASCEESAQVSEQKDTNWGAVFLLFLTTIIVIGLGIFAMKRAKTDDILKIKILIAFGQVMQSFAATYSITWPPVIASFIDQFSIVSFDLFTIGSIECVEAMRWVKTFFAQFTFMVIAPMGCLALLFLGFKVSMYRDKAARADQGKQSLLEQKIQTIEITGQWASRAFLLLILIYLKVSATVLEMFRCRSFEPYPPVWGDHPERNEASTVHQITEDIAWKPDQDDSLFGDGRVASDFTDRKGLEKDMLFTCTENTYILFKAFAIAMVIVYPIGIPALFSLLMFRERDQIADAINQKKFGFLFADYVTMYFMWEILDLMRKLLLSGLMIFFNRGSVGQLLAGMVVALSFLEAQLRLMPYNDLLANIVQIVAFNAIFLNLLGALLTKVKFEDGIDSSLSADFANHFLIFINISVPICVLFMLAFSVGYDMYLISIGKMIKGGLAGKSRSALLDAIGMRKENRKKNSQKKNNIAETGFMALYHMLWKREDVDEALLSEELAYLDKRRDERDKAIILFRQAQVHHEEKREWYRFVYNHTKTEEEFNEIVQTESLASYKRLMLGLEEDMEDDIHERVTREIVQASNVASDEDDDDFANPVYADADDARSTDSGSRKQGMDPTGAPAKKKKKKKKKKEDEEDGWFGEEDVDSKKATRKASADAKSTGDELTAAQVDEDELVDPTDASSKKKKKKKKKTDVVGTDPTADFDVLDDEDPTADPTDGDFDIETSGNKKKKKKKKNS